jgi:NitT/TauT family transport system permease protein
MSGLVTPGRVRFALALALVLFLESLCRFGAINRFAMIPPSEILWHLGGILVGGTMGPAIAKTLTNVAIACILAIIVGVILGALIHRWRGLRETLDPLFAAYYAIPVYAFYPLFIVMFGLGDMPQVLIGFMLGLVAVIVNTLNGLDRVPRALVKTARIQRLGPVATAQQI